jgi:hypothetical protein
MRGAEGGLFYGIEAGSSKLAELRIQEKKGEGFA